MERPIRIIQIGLGPVGRMLTPYLHERDGLEIVGAVDINPDIAGKDLGELCGLSASMGVTISDDVQETLDGQADIAIITTVSELERFSPLLEQVISGGIPVLSTCEELAYPWKTQPDLAARIDALAKGHNVAVLGTGVNPGFLMDFLPVAASAVCREVRKIRIERIQDATPRRLPFRQKIGAGLSLDEFSKRAAEKKIRHVGITESMHMVAARLGWDLDRTQDTVEPVVAEEDVFGEGWTVAAGLAAGVNQIGRGCVGEHEVLTLVFRAAVGEKDPRDRVSFDGVPGFDVTIPGGINGDVATCAVVANAVPVVVDAQPGLRTMVDIPPVSFWR